MFILAQIYLDVLEVTVNLAEIYVLIEKMHRLPLMKVYWLMEHPANTFLYNLATLKSMPLTFLSRTLVIDALKD